MSHWEKTGESDEWFTPAYIFDALGVEFDLDVASPAGGPRGGMDVPTHVPTDAWLWHDSLETAWTGFVWMNPPFGGRNGLAPWIEKFIAHGNGVMLVPDRTSAPWFQSAAKRVDAILFLSPKVKFERPDGTLGKSPSTGTALMSVGADGNAALRRAAPTLGFLAIPVR